MKIEGVAALVTGGASGLGGATAALLAERGAKVAILDMNAEVGQAHATAIGGRFIQADVTDDAGIAAAVAEAEAAHGVARILVNCAGLAIDGATYDENRVPHDLERFRRIIDVNLVGTFNVISKFAARLAGADPLGEERGVIINTASVAAYDGQIGLIGYSASKGAVAAMTLPLARDLARDRIRVVSIAPGFFWTPMLSWLPDEARAEVSAEVPHPSRFGEPEEFAHLAEAIVTNPMLNGETIRLDGAIRLPPGRHRNEG